MTTCRKLVLGVGQEDERTLEVPSDEVSHQCGPLALVEAEVGAARARLGGWGGSDILVLAPPA